MNLVPNKQLLLNVPFQPTKYWKKELCVDNKKRETIGDVFCPTCRNEKFVYTSTNFCLESIFTDTKLSNNWSSTFSRMLLQRFTCAWFQQWRIRSQLSQTLFCYPFLLTNETLNPLSSKKRTSLSRSNLVIISYWIKWTFLAEQQALFQSWRHTKLQKQKVFSRTNVLITLTKCKIQDFPHMTPFTVNFVAVTLLKPNTQTMSIFEKWVEHRTSCRQIKTIKATTYWDWELSIPATSMETGANELIHRLFALV